VEALWDTAASISELSVQSAICEPLKDQVIPKDSPTTVRGYAISNGRRIVRVDVSLDNGVTWRTADIVQQDKAEVKGFENRYWSWSIWECQVEKMPSPCTIACRAWDIASNTQPENMENIWNLRGVMNNSWHRVNVKEA
jgi:sulfite oxidase